MIDTTDARDYVETSPRVIIIARALSEMDGADPDKIIGLSPEKISIWRELRNNAFPHQLYGPRWLLFRREALRIDGVMVALGLLPDESKRRYAKPMRVLGRHQSNLR